MAKWIGLIVLLAVTVAISSDWQSGNLKNNVQTRADGVLEYNEYIGSIVVNSTSLVRINGCANKIVKKFANGLLIDTLVFTSCPQTNAFWIVSAMDSLDGGVTIGDMAVSETNGDTLFIKRQAITGALRGYCAIRIH